MIAQALFSLLMNHFILDSSFHSCLFGFLLRVCEALALFTSVRGSGMGKTSFRYEGPSETTGFHSLRNHSHSRGLADHSVRFSLQRRSRPLYTRFLRNSLQRTMSVGKESVLPSHLLTFLMDLYELLWQTLPSDPTLF